MVIDLAAKIADALKQLKDANVQAAANLLEEVLASDAAAKGTAAPAPAPPPPAAPDQPILEIL
jgi:hypothetical protein